MNILFINDTRDLKFDALKKTLGKEDNVISITTEKDDGVWTPGIEPLTGDAMGDWPRMLRNAGKTVAAMRALDGPIDMIISSASSGMDMFARDVFPDAFIVKFQSPQPCAKINSWQDTMGVLRCGLLFRRHKSIPAGIDKNLFTNTLLADPVFVDTDFFAPSGKEREYVVLDVRGLNPEDYLDMARTLKDYTRKKAVFITDAPMEIEGVKIVSAPAAMERKNLFQNTFLAVFPEGGKYDAMLEAMSCSCIVISSEEREMTPGEDMLLMPDNGDLKALLAENAMSLPDMRVRARDSTIKTWGSMDIITSLASRIMQKQGA